MLVEEVVKIGGDQVIYFGNLNDIIAENEKSGGINRSTSQLSWDRQTLDLCGLINLGFEGYPFHMAKWKAR